MDPSDPGFGPPFLRLGATSPTAAFVVFFKLKLMKLTFYCNFSLRVWGFNPFLLAVYRMCIVSPLLPPAPTNHWQGSFWGKAERAARAGEKTVLGGTW